MTKPELYIVKSKGTPVVFEKYWHVARRDELLKHTPILFRL